jgi:hypothetical protein
MVICRSCGEKIKIVKPEIVGIFFILIIIPFIYLFGLNVGSIVGIILFLSLGLHWIITKPSKNYICKECRKKESLETIRKK